MFWQELAFRGYLQTRFQPSFGILPGILNCFFTFLELPGFGRPLSKPEVITGTILYPLVGGLYFVSGSIALATALHATRNLYLRWSSEVGSAIPPYIDRALVFSAALPASVILFKRRAWSP